MKVEIRIPEALYRASFDDLFRPHPFAFERVGFFSSAVRALSPEHYLVLLKRYHSIPDEQYIDEPSVGACIGSTAITAAMQRSLSERAGQIHVHIHQHQGQPSPSWVDKKDIPPIVRALSSTSPDQASGLVIFSEDQAWGELTLPRHNQPFRVNKMTVIGFPTRYLI